MAKQKCSEIAKIYKEVIENNNCMQISLALTQILKGYLEIVHKPLIEERASLREQVYQE